MAVARQKKDILAVLSLANTALHPIDICVALKDLFDVSITREDLNRAIESMSSLVSTRGQKKNRIRISDDGKKLFHSFSKEYKGVSLDRVGQWSTEKWSRNELITICRQFKSQNGVGITESNPGIEQVAFDLKRRVRQVEAQALMFRPLLDPKGERWSVSWDRSSNELRSVFEEVYELNAPERRERCMPKATRKKTNSGRSSKQDRVKKTPKRLQGDSQSPSSDELKVFESAITLYWETKGNADAAIKKHLDFKRALSRLSVSEGQLLKSIKQCEKFFSGAEKPGYLHTIWLENLKARDELLDAKAKWSAFNDASLEVQPRGDESKVQMLCLAEVFETTGRKHPLVIPQYQRPFAWAKQEIQEFLYTILRCEKDDTSFLGSVLLQSSFNDSIQVMDGQQRLTTLYLVLCATIETLCDSMQYDKATEIWQTFVVLPPHKNASEPRLMPKREDRADLHDVLRDVHDAICRGNHYFDKLNFDDWDYQNRPTTKGRAKMIKKAFLIIKGWMKSEFRFLDGAPEKVGLFESFIANMLSSLRITEFQIAQDSNSIEMYIRLNSMGKPLDSPDLIRGDIYERVPSQDWKAFSSDFEKFEGRFPKSEGNRPQKALHKFYTAYFRSEFARKKENVKSVREWCGAVWGEKGVTKVHDILKDLENKADCYVPFMSHPTTHKDFKFHDKAKTKYKGLVPSSLERLWLYSEANLPDDFDIFVMNAIHAIHTDEKGFNQTKFKDALTVLISMRLRWVMARKGSMHGLKVVHSLWEQYRDKNYSTKALVKLLESHPEFALQESDLKDANFIDKICHESLYKKANGSVARTILLARLFDDSSLKKGDDWANVPVTLEHVFPKSWPRKSASADSWKTAGFTKLHVDGDHSKTHMLGNLVFLSPKMQGEAGQKSFDEKRMSYISENNIPLTSSFGNQHKSWGPADIDKRTRELADFAAKYFKNPFA